MLVFNLRAAKEKLSHGPLPDREVLPYLLVLVALYSFVAPGWSGSGGLDEWRDALFSLIISIWGVHYLYRSNGGSDGCEFLQRYLLLGWVLSLRYFLMSVPVIALSILLLTGSYPSDWMLYVEWVSRLILLAVEVGYYLYAGIHFRSLARSLADRKANAH